MTPAQLATLKAAIVADNALNALPLDSDGASAIRDELNKPSSPAVNVWRTDAPVSAILDAIDGAKYTPTDAADSTAIFTNRLLLIQTKQINLQSLLVAREAINASLPNIRAWLRDAVIAIPSGVGGATVAAGGASGVNVLSACVRNARRVEAILKLGDATTGGVTAALMSFEGQLSYQDVEQARAS